MTDRSLFENGLIGLERAILGALDSGVNVVQLREKDMPAGELLELGRRLRRLTTESGAFLTINDRVDVALAVRADGVHLGKAGLPVKVARALVGGRLIGRSVHAVPEAIEAEQDGADYLILGTIFPSASHPDLAASGPRLIRKTRAHVSVPVLAIGGITPDNAAQAVADGASGVAVVRSILADEHPVQAARRLVERVREAWPSAALHRGASTPCQS